MAYFYKMIGECIRKLRLYKGYSYREMAVLLDIDEDFVVELEKGRKRIFVDCISKVAKIFGVTIDYLVYGNPNGDE